MAICKMNKIKLVALEEDRQNILDTLAKIRAVEISESNEITDTFTLPKNEEKTSLSIKYDRIIKSIDTIEDVLLQNAKKDYYPKEVEEVLNGFFVSFNDFVGGQKYEEKAMSLVVFTENQSRRLIENKANLIKLQNTLNQLKPYLGIKENFSSFTSTKTTDCFFGTVKEDNYELLVQKLGANFERAEVIPVSNGQDKVILVVALKEDGEGVSKLLTENSFNKCPFSDDVMPDELYFNIEKTIDLSKKDDEVVIKSIVEHAVGLKELKIYADYIKFLLEKATNTEGFRRTQKTFVLEGFTPVELNEQVKNAISSVSDAVFIEFSEPSEDEVVPTLTKNNKLASQTEFITDMYSVPNYREFDPSHTIFFFFMLFMGVIMADMGYGLLMIIVGLFLSSRIKVVNGTKKLWNIIAIGGVFSIIFGFLFNSFFGLSILPFRILPDPVNGGKDSIMLVLLGCLGLGVIQIAVGYFLKAVNCFRDKKIIDGLCDGILWVIFFIGFVFAGFNFILDYLMSDNFTMNEGIRNFFDIMTKPGLIMVIGSVVLAALTAGRHEKGFGKFTKGFGAVYGLINLMSDILSYARLFGLMLSGMIIAQTFNDIGGGLISGGGVGLVLGVIVILIGHAFNIAMGVLGAYIHDSRLQYIEYFSKFYTGEGEKFKPFGSDLKYIYIKN